MASTLRQTGKGGLLGDISGFDRTELKSAKTMQSSKATNATPQKGKGGLLSALAGFDRTKLKSAKKERPAKAATATPQKGKGGLLSALAGFDRTKLKSAKKERPAKATPRKSCGGGIVGALAGFDRSKLKSAKKARGAGFRRSTVPKRKTPAKAPASGHDILKNAVLNRNLRKVKFKNKTPKKKMTAVGSAADEENSCESPAFARFKLRKTGRRSMGGSIKM
jgi:hypothetical protein